MEMLSKETNMSDIRLARPDDAQAVHLILQETWGESLLFDVFINHISLPEHQVFVAVEAGEVAGFLKQTIAPHLLASATNYGQYHRWQYEFA